MRWFSLAQQVQFVCVRSIIPQNNASQSTSQVTDCDNQHTLTLKSHLSVPVYVFRLHIDLLDEGGDMLGSLEPLVPSSGGALAKTRQVRQLVHTAVVRREEGTQGGSDQGMMSHTCICEHNKAPDTTLCSLPANPWRWSVCSLHVCVGLTQSTATTTRLVLLSCPPSTRAAAGDELLHSI